MMASSSTLNLESLRITESPKLDTLPLDILFIILGYLDTARSLAQLAATCRRLNQVISTVGWRIFVTSCFSGLRLPKSGSEEDWAELARELTTQSRDWDRRAFILRTFVPPNAPTELRQHNARRGPGTQSIPGNIIVDAHLQRRGGLDEELVVWGSGEDIFARIRCKNRRQDVSETWHCSKGSEAGFLPGKDDTTAISILKGNNSGQDESLGVIVGRANGDLRLLSISDSNLGHLSMRFRPSRSSTIRQRAIQSIDIERDSGFLAAGTRKNVLLYSLPNHQKTPSDVAIDAPSVDPTAAISLKNEPKVSSFDFIRSIKCLNKETIAVALNRSHNPILLLDITTTGLEVSKAVGTGRECRDNDSDPRTVRALLPVDLSSIASGSGNVMLSSWDDGTIRLQDVRTPSSVDRVYQDNFDVATPINALVSHGIESFIAGSAYAPVLKIFDYRWPRGYYHTDSLACSQLRPYPAPRPPTVVDEPVYHDSRRSLCDHTLGRLCQWHALSRHDFYRPNCNLYLPIKIRPSSPLPIYSLAKLSDISPTIYAGLSGHLAELTLRNRSLPLPLRNTNSPHIERVSKMSMTETGDGSAILDVSKCERVPRIRRQSFSNFEHPVTITRSQHRLDEALQDPTEY